MVGACICNLSVSDSDGGNVSAHVAVRILNVNDPPSIRITDPSEGQAFEHNRTIDLTAEAFDDDIIHGDVLRFEWRADGSTVLGTRLDLTGIKLSSGNHTITLTARDVSNAGARASVNITVKQKPVDPPPPPPPPPPPVSSTGPRWSSLVIGSVAVVAAAGVTLAVWLALRRKR
jgi:hypothetical protein